MENKIYPFKFLDAYTAEDKDIFFGREEEVKQLYQMIYQSDILLLYGASGTGKTSLIQCGLASRFQQHDWLEAFIRRNKNLNESLQKALIALGGEKKQANELGDLDWLNDLMEGETTTTTATTNLSTTQQYIKNIYLKHFRPIYLIFDQFEELFILGNKKEQAQFIATVQEILKVEQPIKLIFSIREEYLGSLYEFEKVVPELLRKKLRIDPMNLEKVKAVILGATASPQSIVHIQKGEEEAIAEQVFEKIRGEEKTLTIQLPYLQVFLDKYYREISKDKAKVPTTEATFTLAALQEIGDIGNILRDFLEEQIIEISKANLCDHKTIWQILSPFVTVDGTKEPISLEGINVQLPNISSSLIESVVFALVNRRILRYTEEEDLYEIAHDSLALRIAEKRSDEEIHLLEVKNLIKSQSQLKDETRELFSEKQLAFIDPFLRRIILSEEEELLIEESRMEVAAQQRIKRRNKIILGVSLIVVFVIIGLFAISSQHQKNIAQKAFARNQNILDAMDFYDEQYALAFSNGQYGFIDKEGEVRIPYEYEKGEPFDPETGFAKMGLEVPTKDGIEHIDYLIDTNANRYRLVNMTEELLYGGQLNTIFSEDNVKWIEEKLPKDQDRERLLATVKAVRANVAGATSGVFTMLEKEEGNLALNFSGLDKKATIRILDTLSRDSLIRDKVMLLFLQHTQLEKLPNSIAQFRNLKELDLSHTPINDLPVFIGQLQKLAALNLSFTKITEVPKAVAKLIKLKRLYLKFTEVEVIPDFLRTFYKLTTLDVSNTSIDAVPDFISEIQNLERLDLSGTSITNLPSSLGQLNQMTTLDLDETQLEELPSSVVELENLKELNLSYTALKQLPYAFGKLKQLTTLLLNNTQLKELPNSFGTLQNLKQLRLNDTPLKVLPNSFGELQALTFLDLSNTQLKNLPSSFCGLARLELLYLNISSLETLPICFGKLQHLQELYLANTQIQTLPKSFSQLKRLEKLSLTNSPLSQLPASFGNLEQLEDLTLQHTALKELPSSFGQLQQLAVLNLDNTAINSLPSFIGKLQHLKRIYTSKNFESFSTEFYNLHQLEVLATTPRALASGPIDGLKSIRELYFKGNFSQLPKDIDQLKKLHKISIYQNYAALTLPNWNWENLASLQSFVYNLQDNEHYSHNKAVLAQLQQQLPDCDFDIIDQKLKQKGSGFGGSISR